MPALNDADLELLSAYLDNELSFGERAELERRLRSEPDLRAELDDLRRVTALMRVSAVRAPRDFRLDPAVYGRQRGRPGLSRRAYGYRLASATSALAAGLLLVIGLVLLRQPSALLVGSGQPPSAFMLDESQAEPETAIALAPTSTPQPTQTPETATDETPARVAPTATPTRLQMNMAAPPATATLPSLPTLVWQKTGTPEGDMAFEAAASSGEVAEQAAPETAVPPEQAMLSFGAEDQGMGTAENTLPPAPFATNVPAPAALPSPSPLLAQGAAGMSLTATPPRLQSAPTQTLPSAATPSPAPGMAALPTAAPTVAAALPQHEDDGQPGTAAPSAAHAIEPGMLVGGAVILLALAVVFWALSRRAA